MMKVLLVSIITVNLALGQNVIPLQFDEASVVVNIMPNAGYFTVARSAAVVQKIYLGVDFGGSVTQVETAKGFLLRGKSGNEVEFSREVDVKDFSMVGVSRRNLKKTDVQVDCVDFLAANWYGGPQQKYQYWPIQKLKLTDYSYVSKEADNCAVADRYWLSSLGSFIYVDTETPLFLDQNYGDTGYLCLEAKKKLPYDVYGDNFSFSYKIGVASNAKVVHMEAVKRILGKPTGHPSERMVRHPVWSTWARYKADIDDKIVQEFADQILLYKFSNSQYEIDDDWEVCYGALTFSTKKFPNIKGTVDALKAKGFKVTLWIHPFINKGCEPWYSEAKAKGYFVADHNGNTDTQWWNSKTGEAAYIDFTKAEVAQWFSNRLKKIQADSGIDSFKFDAGEASWSPPDPVLVGPRALHPHLIVSDYIRTVAQFGDLVEVRSAHNTQDLPIFLRMIDKDSEWYWNNGLPTLVTTLLQLNMVGYPLVLPDMIGGNGYNNHPPNKEMFIRWLQANVFMPSLQFSFVPWDYDAETIVLSLKFTKLHDTYTDKIMERFKLAVSNGDPVNPPLWWIAPEDKIAQTIDDQFLLGEDIIAAPVLKEGHVSRDVYLPKGTWADGNSNSIYTGPRLIKAYPAPLSVLPYFVRQATP